MIRRLFNPGSAQVVGIEIRDEGLAVALGDKCALKKDAAKLDFLLQPADDLSPNILSQWVNINRCAQADCHVVLNASDYQLLLIEPPDVPESELQDALRWRLKDLLNVAPEDAVIDYFFLPKDGTKSQKQMCYVVATRAERIRALVQFIEQSHLRLCSIDIPELALRNVSSLMAFTKGDIDTPRARVLVRATVGAGEIMIFRQQQLYLARSFSLNYDGHASDLPIDALVLEIQRSVDYFERQMGLAPPKAIDVCGDGVTETTLTGTFKDNFGVPVELVSANLLWTENVAVNENSINEAMFQVCMAAVGVLFRAKDMAK